MVLGNCFTREIKGQSMYYLDTLETEFSKACSLVRHDVFIFTWVLIYKDR